MSSPSSLTLALLLFYMLTGVLPQLLLFLEYKRRAWRIMQLYSPLYLFPSVVFPFLLVFFRPVVEQVLHLSFFATHGVLLVLLLVTFAVVAAGLDSITDPAVFGIKPRKLRQHSDPHLGLNALEIFDELFTSTQRLHQLKWRTRHFKVDHKSELTELERYVGSLQIAYANCLKAAAGWRNWSLSVIAYFVLMTFFVGIFVASYLCLAVFLKSSSDLPLESQREFLKNLTIVFVLFSLWMPMRVGFVYTKRSFYRELHMIGDVPLAVLFLAGCGYLLVQFFGLYETVVFNIVGLVVSFGGTVISLASPAAMSYWFGVRSTPANYVTTFMCLLLILLPLL